MATHPPRQSFDHDAHARSRPETDFWGQIRRTVNGQPVSEAQIDMIVERVRLALNLQHGDVLLDLACGNGALGSRLFDPLSAYLGVDFSPRLIEVAQKYFAREPTVAFMQGDASEYVTEEAHPHSFNKVLCYGSFSYFSREQASNVLKQLHTRFDCVSHVFIGNLPDRDLAHLFYKPDGFTPAVLDDHTSPIGIWRTRGDFVELARTAGWKAEITTMPAHYYAAHYRYDVLLTR